MADETKIKYYYLPCLETALKEPGIELAVFGKRKYRRLEQGGKFREELFSQYRTCRHARHGTGTQHISLAP